MRCFPVSYYLSFARSREKSLSRGKNATASYIEQLEPTSDAQHGVLKMLTTTQLRGLRPHELLVLAALCDVDWRHIDPDCSDDALTVFHNIASRHAITVDGLRTLLMMFFPDADRSGLPVPFGVRHIGLFLFHCRERQAFRANAFGTSV